MLKSNRNPPTTVAHLSVIQRRLLTLCNQIYADKSQDICCINIDYLWSHLDLRVYFVPLLLQKVCHAGNIIKEMHRRVMNRVPVTNRDQFRLNHKNIERHTADTIVSWPYPKQWVIVHTSDLMMIIRQINYSLSIITRGMSKLKT